MPPTIDLIDILEMQSQKASGITIISDDETITQLSYKQLFERSRRYLFGLQAQGIQPGDKIILQLENVELFLYTFWACVLGSIIPVPVTVGTNDDRKRKLLNIWKQLGYPRVMTEQRLAPIMERVTRGIEPSGESTIKLWQDSLTIAEEYLEILEDGVIIKAKLDDIALIQYSSGSTGDPKGVIVSHRNLLVNTRSIITSTHLSKLDRTLSWLPLTHDFGLIGFHLTPLIAGVSQILMPTSRFIRNPILWLTTAQQYKATVLSSPNFGYQYFLQMFNEQHAKSENWDLSGIRMILNGAEPIDHSLSVRFMKRLQLFGLSNTSIVPSYGMAEATLTVSMAPLNEWADPLLLDRRYLAVGDQIRSLKARNRHGVSFVDLGIPLNECHVRICDDEDLELIENTIGHIQLHGDNVTRGYFGNDEASRQAFTSDGWLKTGDLGLIRNGRIYITGRSKDILFINGQNVYPHDIERVAEENDGITLGRIAACGVRLESTATELLVLFVFWHGELELFTPLAFQLKQHINAVFGIKPHAVIPIRRIPKTTSGKMQRYVLAMRYQNGQYAEIEEQINRQLLQAERGRQVAGPISSTERKLLTIWRGLLQFERIGVDESFFTLGGDSLKAALLVTSIRRDYQVEVPIREVFRLQTIRELAAYVDEAEPVSMVPITPVLLTNEVPLTTDQLRVFMMSRMHPNSTSYNIPFGIELPDNVDNSRILAILQKLIKRHQSLRTSFSMNGGDTPVQLIHPDVNVVLTELLSNEKDLDSHYRSFVKPFDLSTAPLFRVCLVKDSDGRRLLLFDIHHIVADATSISILLSELVQLYEGKELSTPFLQYKDYSIWQQSRVQSDEYQDQLNEWLEMFRDGIPVLNLPSDYPRPAIQSFAGARFRFQSGSFLMHQLKKLAEESNTTIFMVLLAAFKVLFARFGGTEDIVVGTPTAGRLVPGTEDMVGMFVNMLPIRSNPKHKIPFLTYLKELRDVCLFAFDHQNIAFQQLVQELALPRDIARHPIFDVMFVMQNQWSEIYLKGKKIVPFELDDHMAKFDVGFQVIENEKELNFDISYCTDLFQSQTIQRMATSYLRVLEQIVDSPETPIGEIDLLSDIERTSLLTAFNNTKVDYPEDKLIHELFENQAKQTPDRVAIVFEGQCLTYRELDEKAEAIARILAKQSVGPDCIIGIMAKRSTEMIIGMLGILKAGAAYLPIEPDFPAERIVHMLEDSKATILLVHPEPEIEFSFEGLMLPIASIETEADVAVRLSRYGNANNLAYCIYTSGSTGRPKGVLLEHRSVVNFITGMMKHFPLADTKRLLSLTTFTFDIFVLESWLALCSGITVILSSEEERKNPQLIARLIRDHETEIVQMTPSLMRLLLEDEFAAQHLRELRLILLGGEGLPMILVEKLRSVTEARIFNMYGPTETTVWSTRAEILDPKRISVGTPIANTQVYIVNESLQLQPIGVAGELCIGGAGLARGYLNLLDLTAEKFIENPFKPDERLYRTGDLARWLPDGTIEHLGRIDHQVKIRGYRIELGEIESRLMEHVAVKEVAVVARVIGEEKVLCTYFMAESELKIDDLRRHLAATLPSYMVPTYFTPMEQMPLTSNGKLDRNALPDMEPATRVEIYTEPSTPMEERLVSLWQEVLGVERVGTTDNFFELGGHSLKAMQMVSRIHRELGADVPLREIFRYSTVKEITVWIEANATFFSHSNIEPSPIQKYYPLSSAQKRMYVLQQMNVEATTYNIPVVWILEGKLDHARLEQAFQILISQHESLRTRFVLLDGIPMQQVMEHVHFKLNYANRTTSEVSDWVQAFIQPFDMSEAPLLRVGMMTIAEDRHLLAVDFHHIIADGMTINLLARELSAIYDGEELPQLRIQYKDFSVWQNERMKTEVYHDQERYWLEQLGDELPVLQLPTDRPRPAVQSYLGDVVESVIDADLKWKLDRLAKESGSTLYMVLLAAFQTLISRHSGQEDIIVGSPIAGRLHADLDHVAGMFVNTLAIRANPQADKTFRAFLDEIREKTLGAYERQEVPFEALVENLGVQRDPSRNPVFDVMFVWQNFDRVEITLDGLKLQPYNHKQLTAKFDLTLQAEEQELGIKFKWEYSTSLFDRSTIDRWTEHWLQLLNEVTESSDVLIADIDLLPEEEKRQLAEFNNVLSEASLEWTVYELFEKRVEQTPDEVAVLFEDRRLTFCELNAKANLLAKILQEKGVGPEVIVGVVMHRSWEILVGILGIWKAGGAYLPIDPSYPQERIKFMLDDSNVDILLTNTSSKQITPYSGTTIQMDSFEWGDGLEENLPATSFPSHLAYVIYTSGTTGQPKGVMVEHRSIANNLHWHSAEYGLSSGDIVLPLYSFTFDASILHTFSPLLAGASVLLLSDDEVIDPNVVSNSLELLKVAQLCCTPGFYSQLLEMIKPEQLSLRLVTVGGDSLPEKLIVRSKAKMQDVEVANEYGPTESSVTSTILRDVQAGQKPTIGHPIPGTSVHIVNQSNRILPIGIPGELCISGRGLARGYLNRPDLTTTKFIENSFGERMYRTGDLARWLPDGKLEYLGRIDQQVKMRGYRIELGEIESRFLEHASIKEVVVDVYEDIDGDKMLCAYYIKEFPVSVDDLRAHLMVKLPSYMVPTFFIPLEKIPLTRNSKIDHKALLRPIRQFESDVYEKPATEMEKSLSVLWCEVLGVQRVGINANFFEIGGHSLKAMMLIGLIQQSLSLKVPLGDLFRYPTLREFAACIESNEVIPVISRIEPTTIQEYYPLTSSQKQMYVLKQIDPNAVAYNMSSIWMLEGQLNLEHLEHAFRHLINRHESFRTKFILVEGEPKQQIVEDVSLTISYKSGSEAMIGDWITSFVQPFDLSEPPLLRVGVMKVDEEKHLMAVDMHHIISDGASMNILVSELNAIYNGLELPEMRIQYKDYAVWQNKLIETEAYAKWETYWLDALAGELPVLQLPTDRPRPSLQTFDGDIETVVGDARLTRMLKELGHQSGATLYMVLLAAFQTLLSRYSGQDDILVGSPTAGRSHTDLESVVGMFVNTLVLRGRPQSEMTFRAFLEQIKDTTLRAFENQDVPLHVLMEKLDVQRDAGRNPLFDVMFAMQNIPINEFNLEGLKLSQFQQHTVSKFDLTLTLLESTDTLQIAWEYNIALFERETIQRWAQHWLRLLEQVAQNPDIKLSEINLLTEWETQQLLVGFNQTAADYPNNKTVHELFEEQVERTPDRVAVVFEGQSLTYAELDAKGDVVARVLAEQGAGPDRIVGIMAKRSPEMIIGMLGVLKAGAAYLPIDPDFPAERITYMLEDSGSEILLVHPELERKIVFDGLVLPVASIATDVEATARTPRYGKADSLAYCIYTSGSTGRPKGVLLEHCSVVNFITGMAKRLPLTETKRLLTLTTFTFDIFVLESWLALCSGITVILSSEEDRKSPQLIAKLIRDHEAETVQMTPSLMRVMLEDEIAAQYLRELRFILLGGEGLPLQMAENLRSLTDARIFNMYGPTETTVWSTGAEIVDPKQVSVGTPIANTKVYIVNDCLRLQPIGVAGELCIGGAGLARGYLNLPELTAEQFVVNPFKPGERMYKTGDLARWLPDGNIEHLGRIDHQVKIRGYRIELGEIESRLLEHDAVKEAVVVARADKSGDSVLCAYYVAGTPVNIDELRTHLASTLSSYMVPTFIAPIERMPLTSNGKLDRNALSAPEHVPGAVENAVSTTETEERIIALWQDVLAIEKVGITDHFFEIGGHSLKAMTLVSRIQSELGTIVPLRELFSNPTVQKLAAWIEANAIPSEYARIEPTGRQEYYTISSAQKRMIVLQQMDPKATAYNMPVVLTLEGMLDRVRLEEAFRKLIARHEPLRTRFVLTEGEPVQQVLEDVPFAISFAVGTEEEAANWVQSFVRPFDLHIAPLLRVGVLALTDRHLLAMDFHHIISDGVTMSILVKEFSALYNDLMLPPLRIQYKDFAQWERRWHESEAFFKLREYWHTRLNKRLPILQMPLDFHRGKIRSFKGNTISLTMVKEDVSRIQEMARQYNVTMNTLLLSLYAVLLCKYSAQDDIMIGSTVAGRNHADLEKQIGMFINFLPIRFKVKAEQSFTEFVEHASADLLDAYEHQDYPFDNMVDGLNMITDPARNPIFDTMLNFHQENNVEHMVLRGLQITPFPLNNQASSLDFKMDIHLEQKDSAVMQFDLQYNVELFTEASMRQLMSHFEELIRTIVRNPTIPIAQICLFSAEEEAVLSSKRWLNVSENNECLAISATFTAELIEDYVKYWTNEFDLPVNLRFAAYNQIFQEILDTSSLLSGNKGANVLLIRFEDWLRDDLTTEDHQLEQLDNTYAQLVTAIREKYKPVPYFVGLFPISPYLSLSDAVKRRLGQLNERWKIELAEIRNVYTIDFNELANMYGIHEIFDVVKDRLGHAPFSDEYYAAMGTAIARQWVAWNNISQFKVIVLDCDQTLWKGICGEDGALGVSIEGPYEVLQRFMLDRKNEGMILALSSKNNELDVWEVFDNNPGMILKKEDFAAWKINWQSKSINVRDLALELNVGIDSFVFVDDSAMECSEMMMHCPEVLTLQLPYDSDQIPSFLKHVWAFDRLNVTKEAKQRTEMYASERRRKEVQDSSFSIDEFLSGLDLQMDMRPLLTEEELERAAELTQRTNQFNLSTIRRTESELRQLLSHSDYRCLIVEVRDRFGDYGIVGLVILKRKHSVLVIDTFLLSCRVLGRNVENAVLIEIKRICIEEGMEALEASYILTEKNKPFLEFIERSGWKKTRDELGCSHYYVPLHQIPDEVKHIQYYDAESFTQKDFLTQAPLRLGNENLQLSQLMKDSGVKNEFIQRNTWEINLVNKNQLLHDSYYGPLACVTNEDLIRLPILQATEALNIENGFSAPRSELETKLAFLWEDILKVDRVGCNDNFFELGGNSLKAMTLISRMHRELGTSVPLRELFRLPTVRQLAEWIQSNDINAENSSIEPAPNQEYYTLSSAQKQMYVLQQMDLNATAYNMPSVFTLAGKLNRERLEYAFRELIARHESLRTRFILIEGEPKQQILEQVPFTMSHTSGKESEADKWIAAFVQPFNLDEAPLLRLGVMQVAEDQHLLAVDMHHIISDGVTRNVLIREINALYSGMVLSAQRIQYKDFSNWQNSLMKREEYAKREAHWLESLAGELPVLHLPTDRPRPSIQNFMGNILEMRADSELKQKLERLAQESNTTLYMVLLAAYQTLLSRYSGQDDIIVGSPVAGRLHADVHNMVGMFANTVVINGYPHANKTFCSFLQEIRETVLEAFDHQDIPFEALVEKLELCRDLSHTPVFNVLFALHNMERAEFMLDELKLIPYKWDHTVAKFDLTLQVEEQTNGLLFTWEYSTSLFDMETIRRWTGHWLQLLEQITEQPNLRLGEIDLLTGIEKWNILTAFNDSQIEYPEDRMIHELFEDQAKRTPNRVAVVFEDRELTYREIDERANAIAKVLIEHGAGSNQIVGIMATRSPDMIIGMLGILKSDAGYLTIDPDFPEERIVYMLDDSKTKILLIHPEPDTKIPFGGLVLPIASIATDRDAIVPLQRCGNADNLAYCIYTSGSTGKPKGVLLEHRSVINFITGMMESLPLAETNRLLSLTTFTFDPFVLESWVALCSGMTVILASDEERKNPQQIAKLIREHRAETVQMTPSLMRLLLEDECAVQQLREIRLILLGGEGLPPVLTDKLRSLTDARIFNMYGPTETTVWSTSAEIVDSNRITVGTPIANTQVYIVNKSLELQPIGVAGELFIGGAGLARGYLNLPALSAEKFVENPFRPGERLYRTGDLARWLPDGTIEHLGRIDHQVKIRGYRVELGEIENRLIAHEAVKEAAVVAHEVGVDRELCAYFVAESEVKIDELRLHLGASLPSYMVPKYITFIERMPLNSNGKLDRKALPDVRQNILDSREFVAPVTEIEVLLASIWQKVLHTDRVGIYDNFFVLGGDSIKAIQIVSHLHQNGWLLEVKKLLRFPTITTLVPELERKITSVLHPSIEGEVSTTPAQQWYLQERGLAPDLNLALMLYCKQGFNKNLVGLVFKSLISHHDSLRMIFKRNQKEIVQWCNGLDETNGQNEFFIEEFDLSEINDNQILHVQGICNKLQSKLDLEHGPSMVIGLFHTIDGDHLFLTIHHLLVDGVSARILTEDFISGYNQAKRNEIIKFPQKTSSIKSWASCLREYATSQQLLNEIEYWRKIESTKVKPIKPDRLITKRKVIDSNVLQLSFTVEESDLILKKSHRAYNTEVDDLLLTALGLSIAELSDSMSVVIELESHGREELFHGINVSRTIGWFTSMYPVVFQFNGCGDLGSKLKLVKNTLRGIPHKGIGYGILKYLSPRALTKELNFNNRHQVNFNYVGDLGNENSFETEIKLSSFSHERGYLTNRDEELFDPISVYGYTFNGCMHFRITYHEQEFCKKKMINLFHGFKNNLLEIAKYNVNND
ncbi:amino acid adenylation domain-containing protein [Cohnella endophytica]|uniref:Amino acid adenylation domain-containing protein n=1 Tax=Cohnella endophytica TaxID=2419778 RepID=A0A494Y2N4_9BACL|nr:non-ribosomal peptide synthase/polyketide synthase [Cohnella endophytica]RKP54146.1 amino acid adenylation domain-containing protein [Cohnella endophytica]